MGTGGMDSEKKILVIDDNLFILNLVKDILRIPNSKLLTTESGKQGYEIACKEHPDVILLDRRLKDQSGYEFLNKLKGNPETRDIPVTMISSDDEKRHIEGSIAHGAEDYIVKPFNINTLRSKVERLIRVGSIHDDRYYYIKRS